MGAFSVLTGCGMPCELCDILWDPKPAVASSFLAPKYKLNRHKLNSWPKAEALRWPTRNNCLQFPKDFSNLPTNLFVMWKKSSNKVFFVYWLMSSTELRSLCLLGKSPTTEWHLYHRKPSASFELSIDYLVGVPKALCQTLKPHFEKKFAYFLILYTDQSFPLPLLLPVPPTTPRSHSHLPPHTHTPREKNRLPRVINQPRHKIQ